MTSLLAKAFVQTRRRLRGSRLPIYVLWPQPLILVAYFRDFLGSLDAIAAVVPPDRPVVCLFQLGWEAESEQRRLEIREGIARIVRHLPAMRATFLCNASAEVRALSALGFDAVLCNQNAFLNEAHYTIRRGTDPAFDAIYVARITPFKRHSLARGVRSLYLIGDYHPREERYALDALAELRHAYWRRRVRASRMAAHMQRARVGLCLSEAEGAMFVSAEYLLCGLPVVSTRSTGGRQEFLDPESSCIVGAEASEVAEAVEEWASKSSDPSRIRAAMIAKMKRHREVLVQTVQRHLDELNSDVRFTSHFDAAFTHKFGLRCTPDANVAARRLPVRGRRITA